MKKYLYVSFLVILIVSCKNKERDTQEKEVSRLIQKIDNLNDSLVANKMDSLLEMRLAASTLLIRVKRTYSPKKIDLVFGKKVEDFKQIQRELKEKKKNGTRNILGDYILISKLIQEERAALSELESDIHQGLGEQDKYEEYLLFEKRKLSTITELYKQYLKEKKKFIPRFYKGYKELDIALSNWEKENLQKKSIK